MRFFKKRASIPASKECVISGSISLNGAASLARNSPPAVICEEGFVMNMGISLPTMLYAPLIFASDTHRGKVISLLNISENPTEG